MPRSQKSRPPVSFGEGITDAVLDQGIFEGLAGIRLAMRRFTAFSEDILKQAGVSSQLYQAMLAIQASVTQTLLVRELAADMLLPHNGAVQLVDRLEKAGFAERKPSDRDRRAVVVSLTSEGRDILERLARPHLTAMLQHEPLLAESLERLRGLAAIEK